MGDKKLRQLIAARGDGRQSRTARRARTWSRRRTTINLSHNLISDPLPPLVPPRRRAAIPQLRAGAFCSPSTRTPTRAPTRRQRARRRSCRGRQPIPHRRHAPARPPSSLLLLRHLLLGRRRGLAQCLLRLAWRAPRAASEEDMKRRWRRRRRSAASAPNSPPIPSTLAMAPARAPSRPLARRGDEPPLAATCLSPVGRGACAHAGQSVDARTVRLLARGGRCKELDAQAEQGKAVNAKYLPRSSGAAPTSSTPSSAPRQGRASRGGGGGGAGGAGGAAARRSSRGGWASGASGRRDPPQDAMGILLRSSRSSSG